MNSINRNDYLISICFPTRNRAEALDATLADLINNKYFDNEIEIVISDNASNDNTTEVANKYTIKYPNIKYYRNETNLVDENFWLAINRANGKYIKLQNDYYSFTDEGLKLLKQYVREDNSCPIFFVNGTINSNGIEAIACDNVNEYIQLVSTYMTSINIFGIWRDDIKTIKSPLKECSKKLLQVDWTLQLLTNRQRSIVVNTIICKRVYNKPLYRDAKYDWFEIHIKNYYDIIYKYSQSYIGDVGVTEDTIQKDKEKCMRHFRREFFFLFGYNNGEYQYNRKKSIDILEEYCSTTFKYKMYKLFIPIYILVSPLLYLRHTDNIIKRTAKRFLGRLLSGRK